MEHLCSEELLEILHRYRRLAKYGYHHPDYTEAWTILRTRILECLNP